MADTVLPIPLMSGDRIVVGALPFDVTVVNRYANGAWTYSSRPNVRKVDWQGPDPGSLAAEGDAWSEMS